MNRIKDPYIFTRLLVVLIFLSFLNSGCKKKGAQGNEGPATSMAKVTSVAGYPGRNRVKLNWKVPANAGIEKCRVSWNSGLSWREMPVSSAAGDMELIVDGLEEGSYVFSITAYGNGSVSEKVDLSERCYGTPYESSIKNRRIKGLVYNKDISAVVINWSTAELGTVSSEINYTNTSGDSQTVIVAASAESTTLTNFKPAEIFNYRTVYLPQPLAIDKFYTTFETVDVNSTESSYVTMVTLDANGPGDTYQLLSNVLGGTAHEVPDCRHASFGPHITEEFDTELNKNVFSFFAHVTPDDDRCEAIDRQRTEIKTYGPSPASIKAFNGDEMLFKWKFKLAAGFRPSSSFTHVHQIKAGDGTNDGSPLITITPRYGNPNKLEIIHTGNTSASTLGKVKIVDLASFEGVWVEAVEKIKFGSNGTYELVLKRVSDGFVLLSYSSSNMDLWRTEATFIRPKWGIYRSLNDSGKLRDEKVLFADFAIGKK